MTQDQTDSARRQACLEQLKRILPASPPWEAWLAQTGELPPDFDAMPSHADLPDLLIDDAGGRPHLITTEQEWQARRGVLQERLQQWIVGRVPAAPDNLAAEVTGEQCQAGAILRQVQLRFGPQQRATLRLELLMPDGPGPYPVFLTQANHHDWALIALRRGYIGCVYAGADAFDDTDTFLAAYPEYDWSRLMRRAWAGSRCIDYLARLPQANMQQIAITGHSRNGKQSLMATAFDDRIALVISSSSGAGGSLSARYFSEQHFGEGIELITRVFPDWFHPRLRFFAGREHKLPVDLPDLVSLAAPRPCLLSIALNDNVESTWAMQQTYQAVQKVYELFSADNRLRILWRPGDHETWTATIERYLDWCDTQFGRGMYAFPERLIHPWDWERWQAITSRTITLQDYPARKLADIPTRDSGTPIRSAADWESARPEIRKHVASMLGEAPPLGLHRSRYYGGEAPHIAALLGRVDAGEGLEKQQQVFGEYINADIYLPAGLSASAPARKVPAILWLHPFSPSNGYVAMYRRGEQVYRTLARQGFAVFCYDQVGFGHRIEEAESFYQRYPDWSLLGKMVRDAQAALDALAQLPYVDARQVWGLGYGLGSLVGLHLAGVDDRLAGLVSVCGPPPFRLDTDEAATGGIRRWSHRTMLLPRLGEFINSPKRVPYDVDDLLACLAPQPAYVISPQLDREAPLPLVTQAVESARRVYALYGDAAGRLEQSSPEDYNRLGPEMQALIVEWLGKQIQLNPPT